MDLRAWLHAIPSPGSRIFCPLTVNPGQEIALRYMNYVTRGKGLILASPDEMRGNEFYLGQDETRGIIAVCISK